MRNKLLVTILCLGLAVGTVACGSRNIPNEAKADTRKENTFEMESVSPTENFNIKGVDEINSGLVRVNKGIDIKDVDAAVASKEYRITYNRDMDYTVDNVYLAYMNNVYETYTNGELTQVYGTTDEIKKLFNDNDLIDYLYEAGDKEVYSYVSDDTIWYMYNGDYVSSPLDDKCYVYVIDCHDSSEGNYITIGIENSGIEMKNKKFNDKEIKKGVKKVFDTLDSITDEPELTDETVDVVYEDISGTIESISYSDNYYPDVTEDDIEYNSDVQTKFENTPEANEKNGFNEGTGFTVNSEGYIVGDLPYGFSYSDDVAVTTNEAGEEIHDYIVSEARQDESKDDTEQAIEEERMNRIASKVIEFITVTKDYADVTCVLDDTNEAKVNEIVNKLNKLGNVETLSEADNSVTYHVELVSK